MRRDGPLVFAIDCDSNWQEWTSDEEDGGIAMSAQNRVA